MKIAAITVYPWSNIIGFGSEGPFLLAPSIAELRVELKKLLMRTISMLIL